MAIGVCMVPWAGGTSSIIGEQWSLKSSSSSCRFNVRLQRNRLCCIRASTALAEEASPAEAPEIPQPKPVQRLKSLYLDKVVPALMEEMQYKNIHQVPKLVKVVVNCGDGEGAQNAKTLEAIQRDIGLITGQRPVVSRAHKAIAAFKVREGAPVGVFVTLRRDVMYSFLDRLMNLALPRTKDFQGVSPHGFDGQGNYNMGIADYSVFPEIKVETIDQQRGFDIAIHTTAPSDKEGSRLLTLLGMPFDEEMPKPPKKKRSRKWQELARAKAAQAQKSKAKPKKKK